jgi:hypothetical protein
LHYYPKAIPPKILLYNHTVLVFVVVEVTVEVVTAILKFVTVEVIVEVVVSVLTFVVVEVDNTVVYVTRFSVITDTEVV